MFDDYILPFTKLNKYPEYDEVHEIMRDDVQKKDYTLDLHTEMKTMYENLDTFDFYKWHQEKRIISRMFYVVIVIIIKEFIIFSLRSYIIYNTE